MYVQWSLIQFNFGIINGQQVNTAENILRGVNTNRSVILAFFLNMPMQYSIHLESAFDFICWCVAVPPPSSRMPQNDCSIQKHIPHFWPHYFKTKSSQKYRPHSQMNKSYRHTISKAVYLRMRTGNYGKFPIIVHQAQGQTLATIRWQTLV